MQRHKYTYWTTEELQTLRILRFVEGLPYNEIGIALNRNWQSCYNAVHKYFKKELEDYKNYKKLLEEFKDTLSKEERPKIIIIDELELIYESAEKGIKRAAIAKRLGIKIPSVDYAIRIKKNRLRAK